MHQPFYTTISILQTMRGRAGINWLLLLATNAALVGLSPLEVKAQEQPRAEQVDAKTLKEQADKAYEEGKYADAVKGYTSLLDKLPDKEEKGRLLYRIGFSLGEQEKFGEALKTYAQAKELLPPITKVGQIKYFSKEAEHLEEDGAKLMQERKYAEAIKKFEESLRLENHHVTVFMIGAAKMLKGEKNEAARFYKLAMKKEPRYFYAHSGLAIFHDELGERTKALFYDRIGILFEPPEPNSEIIRKRIKKNEDTIFIGKNK